MDDEVNVAAQVVVTSDDTRPAGWPVRFYICAMHKQSFLDDKNAILDESKPCCICEPCENDSLGG